MLLEPVEREVRHTLERAWLFKQVGCAGDDVQPPFRIPREFRDRLAVQAHNHWIISSDDEQTGREYLAESRASEIRPTSAGNYRPHCVGTFSGGSQRRGRPCTGPEISDPETLQLRLAADPFRDDGQALDEQVDVETQLRGAQINRLFLLREKVDQNRRDGALIQHAGHATVSRTVAAAAAAMCKDHKACRTFGKRKVRGEFDLASGYRDVRIFNPQGVPHKALLLLKCIWHTRQQRAGSRYILQILRFLAQNSWRFCVFWRRAICGRPGSRLDDGDAGALPKGKRLASRRSPIMDYLPFADRLEAGRLLADQLSLHKFPDDAVVLALPRGGVPVGFIVAQRLHLPLDVVVVRKLGVPWQPELAMGAIAGSACVLDEQLIQKLGIGNEEVDLIVSREREEIKRREELYRRGKPPFDLRNRSVILVDDGLATGNTMSAAARYVWSLQPARVTIAIPVGSRQACAHLRTQADDLICLAMPALFLAVGEWYRDFRQVSDAEVQNLLAESRHLVGKAQAAIAIAPEVRQTTVPGPSASGTP